MNGWELLRRHRDAIVLGAIAFAIGIGWFLFDGNVALNLADEGYLWYGTEAVLRGEVPIRDFEGYDPGRYVWSAAWSYLLGHSIVSLRLGCTLFGCLGVFAGLLAARRVSRNWIFLVAVALLLSVWMHPRYKAFEQSIALMAVYAAVLLLEKPSLRRHFAVGIFGGICAIFGRNHGAYHVLAFGLLITSAAFAVGWLEWLRRGFVWGCGILLGYLPQLLLFAFLPRFARAYLPNIEFMFTNGTNLSRPVPWPWTVPSGLPRIAVASLTAEGCVFIALLAFLVLAAARLWQQRARMDAVPRVLLAAACVSIPYTHYAFSRADIVHLAHGAPSAAIGLIALAFTFARPGRYLAYAGMPLAIGGSLLAQLTQVGFAFEYLAPEKSLFTASVRGERMVMGEFHARALVSANHIAHQLAKPGEGIFFAPHSPGLYNFIGQRSPTRQIYFVFPGTTRGDEQLVSELEASGVKWAMVQDIALDGRNELRFHNTNPGLAAYLRKNFRPVPLASLPRDTVLLRRAETPES